MSTGRWLCAVAACWLAGCRSVGEVEDHRGCVTRAEVLAALQCEPMGVKLQAINVVENCGDRPCWNEVERLCGDSEMEVRNAALCAAIAMAGRDPEIEVMARPTFRRALSDPSWLCRREAMGCVGVSRAMADEVRSLLADADGRVRVAAAASLVRNGFALHPRDLERSLEDAQQWSDRGSLCALLQAVDDPVLMPKLEPLASHDDPMIAWAAKEAIERCNGGGRGGGVVSEKTFAENSRRAAFDFCRDGWSELDWSAVEAMVQTKRVVLCGEVHGDAQSLRSLQTRILACMMAHHPGATVLAYEPSVADAQRYVIDYATRNGAKVVALDPENYAQLIDSERQFARDQHAVGVLRELLRDEAVHVMVIRGTEHVLPGGYLATELGSACGIIITSHSPPFAVIDDRPLVGRVFRRGDGEGYLCVGSEEPAQSLDALCDWVDARRRR